jgi:hypothetical protein
VLDDVALRPVLEQPAGKVPVPALVGRLQYVELDKGADLDDRFPGRGRLAGPQEDSGIAQLHRFARFHGQVAGHAIALVEQADDSDPVLHRGAGQDRAAAHIFDTHAHRPLLRLGQRVLALAGGQEQRQRRAPEQRPTPQSAYRHVSGVHAS